MKLGDGRKSLRPRLSGGRSRPERAPRDHQRTRKHFGQTSTRFGSFRFGSSPQRWVTSSEHRVKMTVVMSSGVPTAAAPLGAWGAQTLAFMTGVRVKLGFKFVLAHRYCHLCSNESLGNGRLATASQNRPLAVALGPRTGQWRTGRGRFIHVNITAAKSSVELPV